jgi:hypothetical protein
VPVEPDASEAREWLLRELSGAEYQAARPTLFDLAAQAVWNWLNSLQVPGIDGPPALPLAILAVLVLVGLAVAFLIFGPPRLGRRSRFTGDLFDVGDTRRAEELRASAARLASAGDWRAATAEMFRALATSLAERTIVPAMPGSTARTVASRAADAFPAQADRLATAAGWFDDVRYLDRAGTERAYRETAALDAELRATRPAGLPAAGEPAAPAVPR